LSRSILSTSFSVASGSSLKMITLVRRHGGPAREGPALVQGLVNVWKAKGEEILAKIEQAWKVALGEDKDVI
jgi:hypothetical protein